METLVLYREGELPPTEAKAVEAHLVHCLDCALELNCLRSAAAKANEIKQLPPELRPDLNLLPALLGEVRRMERRPLAGADGDALKSQVQELIAPYLGARAAHEVLAPLSNGEELLSAIEPVLANFLGSRAAAQLVTQVVDKTIVRA